MMQTVHYTPLSPRAMAMAPLIWLGKIIFIVGFVTNTWYSYSSTSDHGHMGLWVSCNVLFNCIYFDPINSWYIAVRALECIALIFLSVGSFQSLIYLRRRFKERLIFGAIAILIGGVVGIIGCIVFAAEVMKNADLLTITVSLGYSFYLTVFGCVLALAGAPLLFLEYRSSFQ
ncbi:hypothetical protein LOTGIDRAFT_169637 [Lottia gigantea]|uniref:Uncharacterized protein n=1 Tax=Lottia gigantea TaxID=225164 RepID=V3ZGE3_LOTGI|nr:hypothetical protein LOTGIDRAFT_169637 [Lottia gigantea]ESO83227.1 hypothetical protein LOTGIDRAFT_169637 [Lottia gigantea]